MLFYNMYATLYVIYKLYNETYTKRHFLQMEIMSFFYKLVSCQSSTEENIASGERLTFIVGLLLCK